LVHISSILLSVQICSMVSSPAKYL
jgi:hypothetical protein